MSQPIVLHITNAPTPYRLPQYRAFQKELLKEGIGLHIHFLGGSRRQREWKFSDEDFAELSWSMGAANAMVQDALQQIKQLRPAVVVLAWAMDIMALRLMLYCRRRNIAVIIYGGETQVSAQRSYQWLRNIFRLFFYKLADGFIAYGTAAQRHLVACGVPIHRTDIAVNIVDVQFFVSQVDKVKNNGQAMELKNKFRTELGTPFTAHLLFVGYVLRLKGIMEMVEAVALLKRPDIALHIVGSGEDETALREFVAQRGIDKQVFMHGYQQKNELPVYYAMADLVLFPSLPGIHEVFGLVMVEASAAGVPVVATEFAGGIEDILEEEVTGLVVDPRNTPEFAAALRRLIDSPELRQQMGQAARYHAQTALTPERSAEGYNRAIVKAMTKTINAH